MKRFFNTLAAVTGAVLLTATFAAAQTVPAQEGEKAPKAQAAKTTTTKAPVARGEIVTVDATSVTLKTAKGEESFAIGADTKVTQGKKSLTPGDLKTGDKASVSYTKSGEQMTATKIAVTAKPAASAKKEAKEPKATEKK